MLILVTNDDGIDAPGLKIAYDLAHKLAGKHDRVAIAAPKTEQSGVSHAMSYTKPIAFDERRADKFAIEGTPTDCVLLAEHLFGERPGLVISGVNRGHNLGPDLLYSGTVGAAIEATAHGIPAISLSQKYGQEPRDRNFEAAQELAFKVISPVWLTLASEWPEARFLNVNFPNIAPEDVKGVRFAQSEALTHSNVIAKRFTAPNHRDYFTLGHPGPMMPRQDGKDVDLVAQGYITLSFCHLDLNDAALNARMIELFEDKL